MNKIYKLGLAALVALGVSCKGIDDDSCTPWHVTCPKQEEVETDSRIQEIRQLAGGHILASGDFMAEKWYEDLQSDDIEKVCHAATWGTGVRYSELMHGAGLSFTPGGGYWRRITDREINDKYLQEARRLDKVRQRLYELCD